jgi:UDP-N-acetylglucosamine--N-acetylmuramyl-(pentapeptide) pyrophosphoryl-undecaprenol N-acetylglucosamine transferase
MPAMAAGRALVKAEPGSRVYFVCGRREQELRCYHTAGVEPFTLPVRPMGRGKRENLRGAAGLAWSVLRSILWLRQWRAEVVVGMGGYVAAPMCLAALAMRKPLILHEQNAVMGRTNRRLARWAAAVAGAYPQIDAQTPAGRFHWTGVPVREGIGSADRYEARARLNLEAGRPVVVVTGGSQGARDLNRMVGEALRELDREEGAGLLNGAGVSLRPPQVIWACGQTRFEECQRQFTPESFHEISVRLIPFVENMADFWAAADLAVARAGASTLAEIALCGLPSILFPLPSAVGGHQARNADALVFQGAARRMSEVEDEPKDLAYAIRALLGDHGRLEAMGRAARAMAKPEAARELAELVVKIARPDPKPEGSKDA